MSAGRSALRHNRHQALLLPLSTPVSQCRKSGGTGESQGNVQPVSAVPLRMTRSIDIVVNSFSDMWSELAKSGTHPPYMLIDCSGSKGAAKLPRHVCHEFDCLFAGKLANELEECWPLSCWSKSFGTDIKTTVEKLLAIQVVTLPTDSVTNEKPGQGFAQLHRHFRKFNVVQGPNNKQLFFRYYDPRLIYNVLQALDFQQVTEFFGPLKALVVAETGGRTITIKAAELAGQAA